MNRLYSSFIFVCLFVSFLFFGNNAFAWCIGKRGTTCKTSGYQQKATTSKKASSSQRLGEKSTSFESKIVSKQKEYEYPTFYGLSIPTYSYPNHPAERHVMAFSNFALWMEAQVVKNFFFRSEYVSNTFHSVQEVDGVKNIIDEYQHRHVVFMATYGIFFRSGPLPTDLVIAKIGTGLALSKVEQVGTKLDDTDESQSYSSLSFAHHFSLSKQYILADKEVLAGVLVSIIDGKDGGFNLGASNFGFQLAIAF